MERPNRLEFYQKKGVKDRDIRLERTSAGAVLSATNYELRKMKALSYDMKLRI